MAGQKQGRSGTGQPGSGKRGGGRQGESGQSGSGSQQGRPRGGGSSGATAAGVRGAGGGRSNFGSSARDGSAHGGRPGQPGGSSTSPKGRPGQPDRGASLGGRPSQPGAATLARDNGRPGAAAAPPAAPRWLQLTTLVLSLCGLGVSIWLTIAHYTSSNVLLCPANSFINCGAVTSSPESVIFGVFPVAVLGLAFYVFMVAINSPWAWRTQRPEIRWARLGSLVVGIVFVLYLVYAELIEIGKICEYCTAVHIITFILFVLIVFNATAPSAAAATARR